MIAMIPRFLQSFLFPAHESVSRAWRSCARSSPRVSRIHPGSTYANVCEMSPMSEMNKTPWLRRPSRSITHIMLWILSILGLPFPEHLPPCPSPTCLCTSNEWTDNLWSSCPRRRRDKLLKPRSHYTHDYHDYLGSLANRAAVIRLYRFSEYPAN